MTEKALIIDPKHVSVNRAGFATKELFIRLPADFVADDLKKPDVWKKLQQDRTGKALRAYDKIFAVAFDQTWIAEAIVSETTADSATLAGVRIVQLNRRYSNLFRDANFAVQWDGTGYYVERISDGQRMTQTVGSPELAERDLRNLYPRRATAP